MEGVIDLAEEVFHMPVRLGIPQGVTGLVDAPRVGVNPLSILAPGVLRRIFRQPRSGE